MAFDYLHGMGGVLSIYIEDLTVSNLYDSRYLVASLFTNMTLQFVDLGTWWKGFRLCNQRPGLKSWLS